MQGYVRDLCHIGIHPFLISTGSNSSPFHFPASDELYWSSLGRKFCCLNTFSDYFFFSCNWSFHLDFLPLMRRKKIVVEEGEGDGDKGDRSSCLTGEFFLGKRPPWT